MGKIAKDYTTPELIAANIARQLKDWGLAHVGITQGGADPTHMSWGSHKSPSPSPR